MAEEDAQPRRRWALFGVRRDYVDALEAKHAETVAENAELTSGLLLRASRARRVRGLVKAFAGRLG